MSAVMEKKFVPTTQSEKARAYDQMIERCRFMLDHWKERQDEAIARMQATPIGYDRHLEYHRRVLDCADLYHAHYRLLLEFGDLEKLCDCYICTLPPTKGESA